jgi:glycosyltransferase involved in cell wall biosynthesis
MLKRLFDIIWGRKILIDAARVLAVTGFEADQYRSMGVSRDKIEIVPHGIDLIDFSSRIEKGTFKKQHQIENGRKIILYLGRIHKMKGLDILTQAFAGLAQDCKNVKLVIAGPDDGFLPSIKKLVTELKITEKVIFTGPLYGQEKLQAYTDADIYVLPSSYEIFGITVLEAWACGRPVIVTDRCGLADVVKKHGGLVVPYDLDSLRNAISKMLDNPSIREEFGKQGRNLVEEKYNWANVALQVESIYKNILV